MGAQCQSSLKANEGASQFIDSRSIVPAGACATQERSTRGGAQPREDAMTERERRNTEVSRPNVRRDREVRAHSNNVQLPSGKFALRFTFNSRSLE